LKLRREKIEFECLCFSISLRSNYKRLRELCGENISPCIYLWKKRKQPWFGSIPFVNTIHVRFLQVFKEVRRYEISDKILD
jgi:hypothetical protein